MAPKKGHLSEAERMTVLENAVEHLTIQRKAGQPYVTQHYTFHVQEAVVQKPATCIYAGKEYSVGSVVYQAGLKYRCCENGVWLEITPDESSFTRLTVGEQHNRALNFLRLWNPEGPEQPLSLEQYEEIITSLENFYTDRGFNISDVSRVTSQIAELLETSEIIHEERGTKYVRIGEDESFESLLLIIDTLTTQGGISKPLAEGLHHVRNQAVELQDEEKILAIINETIAGRRWEGNDQIIATVFADIARQSTAFWKEVDDSNLQRRRRRWITILADALGGAAGGAAGSAAGGPIGAGIGAGLFGAAVSSVFGG
jgi:hypothetical protein